MPSGGKLRAGNVRAPAQDEMTHSQGRTEGKLKRKNECFSQNECELMQLCLVRENFRLVVFSCSFIFSFVVDG